MHEPSQVVVGFYRFLIKDFKPVISKLGGFFNYDLFQLFYFLFEVSLSCVVADVSHLVFNLLVFNFDGLVV